MESTASDTEAVQMDRAGRGEPSVGQGVAGIPVGSSRRGRTKGIEGLPEEGEVDRQGLGWRGFGRRKSGATDQ
jgi:hypothetical protein